MTSTHGSRLGLGLFLGATLALGLFVTPTTRAHAEDAKLSRSEEKRRIGLLRSRARAAYRAQQKMTRSCYRCGASGLITINTLKRKPNGEQYWAFERVETCPSCNGRKFHYDDTGYQILYWEMRSPRFRSQEGVRRGDYEDSKRSEFEVTNPSRLSLANLRKTELVSPIHGLTTFKGEYGRLLKIRWIWAREKNRGNWFLYEPDVDGTWPGEEAPAPAEVADPGWVPLGEELPTEDREAVERVIATLPLASELASVRRSGLRLVLAMSPTSPDIEGRVGSDAVRLLRALFGRLKKETEITVHWLHPWRDRFGHVATRPAWRSSFERDTWSRVIWKNLDAQEQVDLLDWFTHEYSGWKRWRITADGGVQPKVVEPKKPPAELGPSGEAHAKNESRVVRSWIEHAGVRLPKPAAYKHDVTIAEGEIGYKLRGFMTGAMALEVVRQPQSWRDDKAKPASATVSFSAAYLSRTSAEQPWLRVTLSLKRAGRLEAAAKELGGKRLLLVAGDTVVEKVHVNKPYTVNEFKNSQVQVRVQLSLAHVHKLLSGGRMAFRWEHGSGAELVLGREGVAALADLLSRLPR